MAEPEGYVFCNNDLEVYAGDRTRKHGFFTTLGGLTSEGLCEYSSCGVGDVRAWFGAANAYITGSHFNSFKSHFDRYRSNIQMAQGAPNIQQAQVIKEAQGIMDGWANYAKHYRRGGGGPVGEKIQPGGYSWESPDEADPAGPENFDFLSGSTVFALCKEIVDKYYGPASCMRDKFNVARPEGMLPEVPGYGGVTKRPGSGEPAPGGMGVMQIGMMGLGAWIVIKALSE